MALYTDYRPRSFADVSGQTHVVSTLQTAVEQNKVAHAFLFAGTRGTGKTSTARILAEVLLTRGIEDETLKRQIIESARDGNLVDLIEIDAASNTGVDNIRDLIEKIQFPPIVSKAKVYIIDEVHMLSKGAFNALLKTLEEPPPYAYFMLATTELHKIPMTIQSRCQRFLFKRIDEEDIIKRLQFIAEKEGISVEEAALRAIAHHVHGGMRDAVSLLDQLRSLPEITLKDVKERIGETGHEYVEQVENALQQGNRESIIGIVQELENVGVPLDTFLRLLLEHTRTSMHQNIQNASIVQACITQMDILMNAISSLRHSPVPGLVAESALLQLIQTSTPSAVVRDETVKSSTEPPPLPSTPNPTPTSTSNPTTASIQQIKASWPTLIGHITPPSAQLALKNGHPHSVQDGKLLIAFNSSFHRDKAASPEALNTLNRVLKEMIKEDLQPTCVLETDVIGIKPAADEAHVDLAAAARDVF